MPGGWSWEEGSKSNNFVCGGIAPYTVEVLSPFLYCQTFTVFTFEKLFGLDSFVRGDASKESEISPMMGLRAFDLRRHFQGSFRKDWELLGGGGRFSFSFVLLAKEAEQRSNSPSQHSRSPASGSPSPQREKSTDRFSPELSDDSGASRSRSRSPSQSFPISAIRRMVSAHASSPTPEKSRGRHLPLDLIERTLTSIGFEDPKDTRKGHGAILSRGIKSNDSRDNLHHFGLASGHFNADLLKLPRQRETYCAIKFFNKAELVSDKSGITFEKIVERMKVLSSLNDCLFIVKLHGVVSCRSQIGFVFEPLVHGSLKSVMKSFERQGTPFPVELSKFYIACIASALDFMRERLVIHRDVTPRNILFDARGYPRLVDFSRCKQLQQNEKYYSNHFREYTLIFYCRLKDTPIRRGITLFMNEVGRAYSIVGYSDARDVHYRAPEICLREGHDLAVDLWSLGVIVFELFTGKTPLDLMGASYTEVLLSSYKFTENMANPSSSKFGGTDSEEKAYSNSHEQDLQLRDLHSRMLSNENYVRSLESIGSVEAKDFIKMVLCVEPYERWPIATPLTHHDFFGGVDFESIEDGNTLLIFTIR